MATRSMSVGEVKTFLMAHRADVETYLENSRKSSLKTGWRYFVR
jgi:hypothetical protein